MEYLFCLKGKLLKIAQLVSTGCASFDSFAVVWYLLGKLRMGLGVLTFT